MSTRAKDSMDPKARIVRSTSSTFFVQSTCALLRVDPRPVAARSLRLCLPPEARQVVGEGSGDVLRGDLAFRQKQSWFSSCASGKRRCATMAPVSKVGSITCADIPHSGTPIEDRLKERIGPAALRQRGGMEVHRIGQVGFPALDQPGIAGNDQRLASKRAQAREIRRLDAARAAPEFSSARARAMVTSLKS